MKHNKVKCRSRLRSSRLPVRKKAFFYFFAHEKGLGHQVSKTVQLFSNSLFCVATSQKPKMIFGKTTSVDSDRKCKFQRFCPARSDCNNVAHGILSCYKLQGVFSQFTDKIWKLQLKYFSYQRDQRRPLSSTLICISQIHYFVQKNSQNAGVNRAEKAYQCIVYTPMRPTS